MRRPLLLGALAFAMLTATPAAADTTPTARQQATVLFDEGRRLIAAGRFDEACTRFTESQRLDPSSGTLLNLVDCDERRGRLASALATCREAERLAASRNDAEARAFAQRRAGEIEARVPTIRLETAPSETISRVTIDGRVIEWTGKALLVDAGRHRVEVTFASGAMRGVDVEVAADAREQRVSLLANEAPPRAVSPSPSPPPPPAESWRRTTGIVLTVSGAAALAMGTVTGILALSKKNDLDSLCSSGGGSYPDRCGGGMLDAGAQASARSDLATARTEATLATTGLVVGTALVALGVVLYLTGGSDVARQSLFCPIGMPCFLKSARR